MNPSHEHKKTRRREDPTVRKEEILNAAVLLAVNIGYQRITRETVANAADTSTALVTRYFTNMKALKNEVMRIAIEREIFSIIAQGLTSGDSQLNNIQRDLKQKVYDFLIN